MGRHLPSSVAVLIFAIFYSSSSTAAAQRPACDKTLYSCLENWRFRGSTTASQTYSLRDAFTADPSTAMPGWTVIDPGSAGCNATVDPFYDADHGLSVGSGCNLILVQNVSTTPGARYGFALFGSASKTALSGTFSIGGSGGTRVTLVLPAIEDDALTQTPTVKSRVLYTATNAVTTITLQIVRNGTTGDRGTTRPSAVFQLLALPNEKPNRWPLKCVTETADRFCLRDIAEGYRERTDAQYSPGGYAFSDSWAPWEPEPKYWKWTISSEECNSRFSMTPFLGALGLLSYRGEGYTGPANCTVTMSQNVVTFPGAQYQYYLIGGGSSYQPRAVWGPAGQPGSDVDFLGEGSSSGGPYFGKLNGTSALSTITITLTQAPGDVFASYSSFILQMLALPPCIGNPCGEHGQCRTVSIRKKKFRCKCDKGYSSRRKKNRPCEDFCVVLANCPGNSTCTNSYLYEYNGSGRLDRFIAKNSGTDCTCQDGFAPTYKIMRYRGWTFTRAIACNETK